MKNWLKAFAVTIASCVVLLSLVWLFAEIIIILCAAAVIGGAAYFLKEYFDEREKRWRK